jgi:hypothetical protein
MSPTAQRYTTAASGQTLQNVAKGRVLAAMGMHSFVARVLLVEREWQADRTTVVLVREPVGV